MNGVAGRWIRPRTHVRGLAFALFLAALVAALAPPSARAENSIELPGRASQGQLLVGNVTPGSSVRLRERTIRVDAHGRFVFGIGRDEVRNAPVEVTFPDGETRRLALQVLKRDWPIERVDGVPQQTVDPPPEIAARIAREQAAVAKERSRDDARSDFADGFIWPVSGRISGRFGRQRIYNGSPNAPHSGVDVAAASGTPVRAPAAGIVTFASPDLYLTGGTVLIDHGHGLSSSFLHLSRIDVKVGQRVERGETFALVGATGRATGPHLHWGLNWFDVRLDPQLLDLPPPAT